TWPPTSPPSAIWRHTEVSMPNTSPSQAWLGERPGGASSGGTEEPPPWASTVSAMRLSRGTPPVSPRRTGSRDAEDPSGRLPSGEGQALPRRPAVGERLGGRSHHTLQRGALCRGHRNQLHRAEQGSLAQSS